MNKSKFLLGLTEGVVPDLLHIVPVGDDAVLNGVLEGQDTSLGLSLITDVGVLLSHADHDTLVTGAADDGGEDGAGSIITSEASLAHTRAVINDNGGDLLASGGRGAGSSGEQQRPAMFVFRSSFESVLCF